jgi:outer membrane protein
MRYLFFICLLTYSLALFGQENLSLTYDEAVSIALEQNVNLRQQINEMKVVKAVKAQSRGEMAPNVSANLNAYRANGNTFLQQEARTINTSSEGLNASFGADINVFSGFSQLNEVKRANANFEAQQKLIERTSQDVVFLVTSQFLQVLLDYEFLKIAEDNLKTQEVLYDQIAAMVEAGNKPKSDQYDQKAIVKNNELLVLQARNTLSNDKSKLAITLQIDPKVNLTVIDPKWNLDEVRIMKLDLESLYSSSIAHRPDLKQFEYSEIAAQRAFSISKANFAPRLFAFYDLNTRYNDQSLRSLEQQLVTDNKSSAYGLSLNIPIYSGLRNRTQYVRQKVAVENAEIETDNLKRTILNDVRQAYQNFLDVQSAYEVSLARLEAAELALQVQQEKYNLGVGDLVELTNANNVFIEAATGQARAKLNLLFQKVILDYHTGTLQTPFAEDE